MESLETLCIDAAGRYRVDAGSLIGFVQGVVGQQETGEVELSTNDPNLAAAASAVIPLYRPGLTIKPGGKDGRGFWKSR